MRALHTMRETRAGFAPLIALGRALGDAVRGDRRRSPGC